ncbi:MAG: TolC family protein, partial [Capsulimonas sp.]|uniref:TolC family protein n=1 Tax=Capsulimonas sp. TaxID=2494211 RepID=UPI00326521E6
AQARLRSADASRASDLRALTADVKAQYYELLRAKERLALAQDLQSAAETFDVLTRKGVELGARPAVDATQSAMEVTRARQQVTLAAAEADRARASLNILMGRDVDTPIDSLEALPASFSPIDPSIATTLSRSDIAASEATADALRQDARLARAEGKPDIALQYRATSVTRGWRDSGFGVAITLPLLDYGDRRGRIRQSEEAAKAQDDRTRALTAQAQLEVRQAVSRVQSADKILADYAGLTAQAQSLLDASRIGYEEGKTGVGEYLTAQRTFRAVRADEIDARIAAALARAELERASGAFPVATPKETEKTNE